MIYLIILLILAFLAQVLLIRKGLKSAKKGIGRSRQPKSSPLSDSAPSNTRVRSTEPQFEPSAFDTPSQDFSGKKKEKQPNIVEFPGKHKNPAEFADIQRELREKEWSPEPGEQEQSMMDIIQEIRRGTARTEIRPDLNPPSKVNESLESTHAAHIEHEKSPDKENSEQELAEDEILEVSEEELSSDIEDLSVQDDEIEEAEEVTSPEELIRAGIQLVRQEKLDEGITLLEQAVQITPDKAEAYFNLGIAYTLKEFTPKAIRAYQKAIELEPEYGKAFFNLGTLYLKQGNVPQAIENLEQSTQYLQEPIKALWNLYEAYRSSEQFPNALKTLQRLITLEPDDASLHNHLGICYAKLGDYPKAINSWKYSISLGASSLLIYYNLGKTYELCGDMLHAIEQYTQFLELATDSSHLQELIPEVNKRLDQLRQHLPAEEGYV